MITLERAKKELEKRKQEEQKQKMAQLSTHGWVRCIVGKDQHIFLKATNAPRNIGYLVLNILKINGKKEKKMLTVFRSTKQQQQELQELELRQNKNYIFTVWKKEEVDQPQ